MAPDGDGITPLHWVAWNNTNPAVTETLLASGGDLEARNDSGRTPLHNAASNNENPAVIETLLAAGADPEAQTEFGDTPLFLAARDNDNPPVIEALLDAGADLEARTENGRTPLHNGGFEQRESSDNRDPACGRGRPGGTNEQWPYNPAFRGPDQ